MSKSHAQKVAGNIWKINAISGFKLFLLTIPIIVLFFQENGLSMTQIIVLQTIFSLGIVAFEVPSGYFADRYGRKNALVLGSVAAVVGQVIYALSFGFWGFVGAEILLAFAFSFFSGADSALLYDSLLELKLEKEFKKLEGRRYSASNFGEALASVLGGFLALASLRTPFYFQIAVFAIMTLVAISLTEPSRHKFDIPESSISRVLKIGKYALIEHTEIKWTILYGAIMSAGTFTAIWFIQPYWDRNGLPLAFFGVAWAVLQFLVGIFSIISHRVEEFFGKRNLLLLLPILLFIPYVVVGSFESLWISAFFIIHYFIRGVKNPLISSYINELTTSDIRATVLSWQSLLMRIVFSILGPFIGYLNDSYSFQIAFYLAAAIFLFLTAISLVFMKRHKVI